MSTPTAAEVGTAAGSRASGVAIAHNAFYLVLGQIATTGLAIFASAALGRSLGASDFGIYFLVLSMATFAYVVVDWGQMLFVVREVAKDPGASATLLGTSLALRAAGAALVSIPVFLVALALGYEWRICLYALGMTAATLPLFLSQGYGLVFRGRDRMGLDATVSVTNKAAALAFLLALLAMGAGIPGVIAAQALAGLAALAVAAYLFRRRLDPSPLHVSRQTARLLLAGGTPIAAMTVAVYLQPYLEAVLLSKLAPAATVGWYGAAKAIMGTLYAPASIIASASYPRLSRAANDPALFRRELRAAIRPLVWLGALGGVGTYLFADVAIGLVYGARAFGPAATILQVFGVVLFVLFIDVLLGHVITASGRAAGFAVAKIASIVVSTALAVWLIPVFQERVGNGGVGVIVAFALSEIVVFAGSLVLAPKGSLQPAIAVDIGRAVASGAATALLFHLLPPLSPFVGIPLCIAAFAAASVALGLVGRSDLELLGQLVRRRAGKGRD